MAERWTPAATGDLLVDNSLSDTARMIGLWITMQEADDEGWVEIPFDDVRVFLHGYPPDSAIRRHLGMLTGSGWVERKPGGRGHGDRFRLQCSPTPKNRLERSSTLKPDSLQPRSTLKQRAREDVTATTDVDGEEEARGGALQMPYQLVERAVVAMRERGESLTGCRGALHDYLRTRVPPNRQHGYVQTLVSWLDGRDRAVFQLPDGSRLPDGERTGYLATAMNELMAGDESRMKRPVGDPANLKTKLNILLKQRGHDGNRNGSTHRPGAPGATRGEPEAGATSSIRGEREPDTRFD